VYFDTDSAAIRPDAARVISQAAAKIRPGSVVHLLGFADLRGDTRANLDLSKRRAVAVAAALTKAGAKATFTTQARGVAAGSNLQAARRVEIQVG
jgi:outer membrane protein OmpA-like peptidoglycan-associated protein